MLRIGEFSKITKTTVKALRHYDKLGLLKPAFVDSETSYRYYLEEQVELAQRIQAFKSVGLSLDNMRKILQKEEDADAVLAAQKQCLEEVKLKISAQIDVLNCLINRTDAQTYRPTVQHIDAQMVFCSRSFISDVSGIMDFIKQTMSTFKRTYPSIGFPNPDYCCIIYPDESYRETNIFVEYAQSVDKKGEDTPAIKFKELDEITAISVMHRGGYENLRDAYLSAVNFALTNGYEICGHARERYLRGAWNCDSREAWETIVQLPIRMPSIL